MLLNDFTPLVSRKIQNYQVPSPLPAALYITSENIWGQNKKAASNELN